MDLKDLLAITGKPGLYKTVGQNKSSLIVESLTDGKKIPVYSANKISALEDISVYTYEEDIPLKKVFTLIAEKESGGKAITPKASSEELKNYMREVLPDFDQDRVYTSDLKKIFNWYNNLQEHGLITLGEEVASEEVASDEEE